MSIMKILLLLPLLLLSPAVAAALHDSSCNTNGSWHLHNGKCYKLFSSKTYWYEAELRCRQLGGHLASIGSAEDDGLIGRLSLCNSVWIGGYGTDAGNLDRPSSYNWTDGSSSSSAYQNHNFSSLHTQHQRLLTAQNLQWWSNFYHLQHQFVCQVPGSNGSSSNSSCPVGWQQFQDSCYHQPQFRATYVEAEFYCRSRDAHLMSLHSQQQLEAVQLLQLLPATCRFEGWIGLVQLQPCRDEFSNSTCFKWSDRSRDFRQFPSWSPGHPLGNTKQPCVSLWGHEMKTVWCHHRLHFVCKRPAEQRPKFTAAYNFVIGLENLAQPGRFRLLNSSSSPALLGPKGLQFSGKSGENALIDTEGAALTGSLKYGSSWTVMYAISSSSSSSVVAQISGDNGRSSLMLTELPGNRTRLTLYSSSGFYFQETSAQTVDPQADVVLVGVSFDKNAVKFYRNHVDTSQQQPTIASHRYDPNDAFLSLGNLRGSTLPSFSGSLRCFAIAHSALTSEQIRHSFASYCQ